jgi:hypothetical protein
MPLAFEIFAERGVIIDLTVIGDPESVILVRHGLVSQLEVNDGQAAMPHADIPMKIVAAVVRPPVNERGGHALNKAACDRSLRILVYYAANSAHVMRPGF